MNKTLLTFIILFLSPSIILAQPKSARADCNKIKEGTFYFYPANSQDAFTIVRKATMQTEINLKTSDTSFWKVNWEDACVFSVKFSRKTQPMSDGEILFYNSHTTVFKILDITREYYVFSASFNSVKNAVYLTDTMWVKPK